MAAFKDRVFFAAITEAYNTTPQILELIQTKDAFNPYDGLSLDGIRTADSLGKSLITNMPAPAMCEGCTTGMNYYMATALHYYGSKELDQMAKKMYSLYILASKREGLWQSNKNKN